MLGDEAATAEACYVMHFSTGLCFHILGLIALSSIPAATLSIAESAPIVAQESKSVSR